jgi:hypothetical protein
MERLEGFFDLYWDESTKLYWEIDSFDREFLYQVSLASGLGATPSASTGASSETRLS